MIKKIVTLAVGFVFAFVAIFFSVRAEGVAEGKGNGKDATVANPKDFGAVLETLPDAEYYEEILEEAQLEKLDKLGKNAKSLAAAADDEEDDFRPVTVYEKTMLKQSSDSSSNSDGYRNEKEEENFLRRTLYIYYTKDAVYYDSVGTMVNHSTIEYGASEEYTRVITETAIDFDAHLYIGKSGAYMKFNKWETTESVVKGTVKNNKFTEDEEEDDVTDKSNLAKEEVQKALAKHYGQWISIYGGELSEMPDPDSGEMPDFGNGDFNEADLSKYEDVLLTYMAKMICAEIAEGYYEQMLSVTENNNASFAKFAGYLKAYDQPLAYEKSGNIYKMTDTAKQQLLADFGWMDLSSGDYKRTPDVESSYFVIDMNDKKAPAFLTNIDYYMSGGNTYQKYTLRDELGIKHLNNTVVPYTPDTKDDMYTLFGDAVKKIVPMIMEGERTALLVDGLNGAWEVIG